MRCVRETRHDSGFSRLLVLYTRHLVCFTGNRMRNVSTTERPVVRALCMGISLAKYFVDLWQAVTRSEVGLAVEERVRVVDNYPLRHPGSARSWFDGMRGRVIEIMCDHALVQLDGQPWPMLFDRRDLVREAS